ncbi:MAG: hypothetical protein HY854_23140 [Burkholderiales bacterium]|nr:hypothetical protein [Burkholderiales bacterium]
MSFRQAAIAFIAAIAAAPAAFAGPGQWVPGEIGFVPAAPMATLTREQVKMEFVGFVKRGGQLAAGEREYFDPATPVALMAEPAVNTRHLGAPAGFDPYANGGPN